MISRRQPCIPVTYVVLTSNAELGGGLEFTLWHCAFLLFWASLCPACPVCAALDPRAERTVVGPLSWPLGEGRVWEQALPAAGVQFA